MAQAQPLADDHAELHVAERQTPRPDVASLSREALETEVAALRAELDTRDLHLELATDGYWDWDLTRDYEYMSPRFWRNFGYDPAEKPHSPTAWQGLIHPDDLEAAEAAFDAHVNEGEPYRNRVRYRNAAGEWQWVICRGHVLRDAEGAPNRMLGCHQDITDLQTAQAALAAETEALDRANRELQAFAYAVSHDLQEPLRSISGFTTLLARGIEDPDSEQLEFIEFITAGATRMKRMLEELLEYSRSGTRDVARTDVRLDEVVDEARQSLAAAITENDARFEVGELPVVRGDHDDLRRAMVNIFGNAIKYRGEAAPEIRIAAERQGAAWVVSVHDNGQGIPEVSRDRVFDVFKQLHARGDYPGIGMGLAITRRLVKRLGGRIWVEEGDDGGSCFRFTLPASEDSGAASD